MTYAGFWRRFAAVMIDALITFIPGYLFSKVIPYGGEFLAIILYYPAFESSSIQATPGKYIMGMKVVRENGQSLTYWRALARQVLKFVSGVVFFIGYIMQAFTAKRQALHDIFVGSLVVNHVYAQSPDWVGAWMKSMRYVLRVDDTAPVAAPIDVTTATMASTSSSQAPVAPAATVDAQAHNAEALMSIEKLHELYKQGAISEDEYQSKKSELLKQV